MLEIRNVHKSFQGNEVLKGVSLSVRQGDVVVILGPSGSGKTTLLRSLNFLERADEGTLDWEELHLDLSKASRREVAQIRKKISFVFQNYNLFRNKTALENVMEGLTVARKVPKREAEGIARKALAKVGLSERCDYYPGQLSGGQQQRVAIGRALIARPALILADEPTGNLDSQSSQDVMDLLCKASRRYSQTVLMITHNMNLTSAADRVFRVTDGVLEELGGVQQ